MHSTIDIRQMKPVDIAVLHKICLDAYSQNFGHHWNDGGLQPYLDEVFGVDKLTIQLAGSEKQYYTAFINDVPAAFMTLNLFSNLTDRPAIKGLEVDKLYILPQFKGMKIGSRLLNLAVKIATQYTRETCWLAVIDTNHEAILFYQKAGFQFHSTTRVGYPKFREELKGMWRMYLDFPQCNRSFAKF